MVLYKDCSCCDIFKVLMLFVCLWQKDQVTIQIFDTKNNIFFSYIDTDNISNINASYAKRLRMWHFESLGQWKWISKLEMWIMINMKLLWSDAY